MSEGSPRATSVRLNEMWQQAVALHRAGSLAQAERLYLAILELLPGHFDAQHFLGILRHQQGRHAEAFTLVQQALRARPDDRSALRNFATILEALKRLDLALAVYDKLLAIDPHDPKALFDRATTLHRLDRNDEALADYERSIAIEPQRAEAHYNRGNILRERNRHEAIASYDKALAIRPDYLQALVNRGATLLELGRSREALQSLNRALAVEPLNANALINRGTMLEDAKLFEEAFADFQRALLGDPENGLTLSTVAHIAAKMCDWSHDNEFGPRLVAQVKAGGAVHPFFLLHHSSEAALHLQCAKNFLADTLPRMPQPLRTDERYCHARIRLAYLSADFHDHATAYLMAELFEIHDRSRFEVIGVSFGPDDHTTTRARLLKSFDRFLDVRHKGDAEIAAMLKELEVDIAIDLKGYTRDFRIGILARRPAPIQISYLGYPGTTGADFIDYIIADPIVLPLADQQYYTERIVQLPDTYQVNDSTRRIGDQAISRHDAGLPESGFVFCCFNSNYKIKPPVFESWMRLLRKVDGSVLWLLGESPSAERNLRREAAERGVDPARLVFAGRVPLDQHLARHRLADLFLDTLPCNAHTTASDALWAGLPLVTVEGETFAGRVAASLLKAVGLPELVTRSLGEYEALALRLAQDSDLLRSFRARLERNRKTCSLFDTDRFRRHIEAAYTIMWEIWQSGEGPRSFSVPSL